MFWLSKKDGNELFTRLRDIERISAVREEHEQNLEELFIKHDREEMLKYDNIQKRLDNLQKFQYIAIGALTLFEFLHRLGLLTF